MSTVVNCFRSLNYIRLITTNCWIQYRVCGCELLSIFELHSTHNNFNHYIVSAAAVVNCFRSLNYIRLITTSPWPTYIRTSCELLSIFELHSTHNNALLACHPLYFVVNCFRSLNYIRLITTKQVFERCMQKL